MSLSQDMAEWYTRMYVRSQNLDRGFLRRLGYAALAALGFLVVAFIVFQQRSAVARLEDKLDKERADVEAAKARALIEDRQARAEALEEEAEAAQRRADDIADRLSQRRSRADDVARRVESAKDWESLREEYDNI